MACKISRVRTLTLAEVFNVSSGRVYKGWPIKLGRSDPHRKFMKKSKSQGNDVVLQMS